MDTIRRTLLRQVRRGGGREGGTGGGGRERDRDEGDGGEREGQGEGRREGQGEERREGQGEEGKRERDRGRGEREGQGEEGERGTGGGGREREGVYLILLSLLPAFLLFLLSFLLGYVAFRGSYHYCGVEGEMIPAEDKPGTDHDIQVGGVYLGELRDMLKKYLQDEKIESTVRTTHPSGSSEGTALAAEILETFKDLRMDHTWTDSHYATLQFPSRIQRNSLWMVDSQGEVLEEIPLEDPDSYCAYSAMGTATVRETETERETERQRDRERERERESD
uniref:Uncharacterized protein n=1 Tax=Salmo trutta TaxID=8032 RepID=A0A674B9L4_SALTR